MLVFYENDSWTTEDISPRIAAELRESCPHKIVRLKRKRDGFEKKVRLEEIEFQNEH